MHESTTANVLVPGVTRNEPACPVCGGESRVTEEAPGWGESRVCGRCQLDFVNPLSLSESPEALYDAAYGGMRAESEMSDFSKRLAQRRALMPHPDLWFWTPAFDLILEWLRKNVSPGGTVLELGSGLGFVLHTMRRVCFDAVGLDVAERVVELSRRDGFRVWHGTVDTVPDDWVKPDAIVSFFMMHHLVEPVAFLETVRRKWSDVPIAIAQYGPSNHDRRRASPPRTLTRWRESSLRTALEVAGYDAETAGVPSTGAEHPVYLPLRRVLKRTLFSAPLDRTVRRVERRVLPRISRALRRSDDVVVAFAKPKDAR